MAAGRAAPARPPVPRPPGAPLLPAMRHGALQPRAGAGIRGRHHQLGVRHLPAGRRLPARAAGLDHHALDAALQRRGGGASRSRVRGIPGRRSHPHPGHGKGRASQRVRKGRALVRGPRTPAHVSGPRAGRAPLPPAARGGRAAGGPGLARGHHRRLRHRRGRERPGAPGTGLRRGRLPGGTGARPGAGAAGRGGRHLHRHELARDRGAAGHRQGDQRPHHPAAQARGALAPDAALQPQLPALLALRQSADLLRARLLVRAHLGVQGADAGGEPRGRMASARGRLRPLRRVAGEQRGLGALARPLLGHAAPGLGVRPRSGPRGGGEATRGWRSGRGAGSDRISIPTSRSSTSTPGPAPAAARCAGRPR